MDPFNPDILDTLAEVMIGLNRPPESLDALAGELGLSPSHPGAVLAKILIHVKRREMNQARGLMT